MTAASESNIFFCDKPRRQTDNSKEAFIQFDSREVRAIVKINEVYSN